MNGELIHSIVYTAFDDAIGPNPLYYLPTDLPENIRMLVGIKTVTILSGDQGFIPESLIIIPFPSLKLKGIIKYIERYDVERRGKVARSAVTFLFREADDIIFYRYMNDLEVLFDQSARKISKFEANKAPKEKIINEIKDLQEGIRAILIELRSKDAFQTNSEPFPDGALHLEKLVDYKFKIIVCGDPGVGKTSTILRFTDNAYSRRYIPTMGIQISDKLFNVNERTAELVIWDIAGQSKFETVRHHFYQGTDAILLIFDMTNPQSFASMRDWYQDYKKYTDSKVLIGYLFGNKSDLVQARKVNKSLANELAEELNLDYIEVSALTGKNVENSFYQITKKLIDSKTVRMDN